MVRQAVVSGINWFQVYYDEDGPKDFFTKFMEKQMDEAKVSIAKSVMGEEQFKLFSTIRRAETESGIIARMPFDIKGL